MWNLPWKQTHKTKSLSHLSLGVRLILWKWHYEGSLLLEAFSWTHNIHSVSAPKISRQLTMTRVLRLGGIQSAGIKTIPVWYQCFRYRYSDAWLTQLMLLFNKKLMGEIHQIVSIRSPMVGKKDRRMRGPLFTADHQQLITHNYLCLTEENTMAHNNW